MFKKIFLNFLVFSLIIVTSYCVAYADNVSSPASDQPDHQTVSGAVAVSGADTVTSDQNTPDVASGDEEY